MKVDHFLIDSPSKDIKLHCYDATPNKLIKKNITNAILLVHGLQGNFWAEWGDLLVPGGDVPDAYELDIMSENSWIGNLKRKYDHDSSDTAVYGFDLQGHGLSGGWNGSRVNVEAFIDYSRDVLTIMKGIETRMNVEPGGINFYVVGISLGGCIVTDFLRYLALRMQGTDRLIIHPEYTPTVVGSSLLCPALCIDSLRRKFPNRFLEPFARIFSHLAPHAKLVKVEEHPIYTNVVDDTNPLTYKGNVATRLGRENLRTIDDLSTCYHLVGSHRKEFQLLIIHAVQDGFVDPIGSSRLASATVCNTELVMLPDETGMWHYLTREPNTIEYVYNPVIKHIESCFHKCH